jgi:hypothetical protein
MIALSFAVNAFGKARVQRTVGRSLMREAAAVRGSTRAGPVSSLERLTQPSA